MKKLQERISISWFEYLQSEFQKQYFKDLTNFIENEYKNKICYPTQNKIFEAFNLCSLNDLKVVIIGQDPYHGENQANGLCFSVNENTQIPPSLKNIFEEINNDVGESRIKNGDLSLWAKQGVLLLNAILTVEQANPASHQNKGWELFTDFVIQLISAKKKNVVFLLWGNYAIKKGKIIDSKKHLVLKSGHPSPLSANRGLWFGNKHFSKTNEYLVSNSKEIILW